MFSDMVMCLVTWLIVAIVYTNVHWGKYLVSNEEA